MKRLLIEGWRFSAASYAVFTQNHVLDLLRRGPQAGAEVFWRDIKFYTDVWQHTRGLMSPDREAQIERLPGPPADMSTIDASIRIAHPTVAMPTGAKQSWCWVVTEFGILEQSRSGDGRPVADVLRTPGIRYMTPSTYAKAGLVRSGADASNVSIVPHGFDPSIYRPLEPARREELRRAMGWEGRFVFLNVGTMVWNKGLTSLLMCMVPVLERVPAALLVLKGNDQLLASSNRVSQVLSKMPPGDVSKLVGGGMRYLGDSLSERQLADLYGAADCLIAPYHAEGFNMPVMEAAACGTPIICTGGGPTDDFTTSDFCMSIPSFDVVPPGLEQAHGPGARILGYNGDDVVERMLEIITNDSWRGNARRAGPAHMLANYTWEKVTDRLLAALLS